MVTRDMPSGMRASARGHSSSLTSASSTSRTGCWNGERLLPEGFAAASGSPRAPFQEPSEVRGATATSGGCRGAPPASRWRLGAFGQMLWVDIERGVSIAQFGAQGGDDSPDTNPEDVEDTHAAMRAIAARSPSDEDLHHEPRSIRR